MDPERRPRILVAVTPRLLEDIVIRVLGSTGLDDVHELGNRGRRAMFDAAVVTGPLPEGVGARLVVRLSLEDETPQRDPAPEVTINDFVQVLATLDQAYPSAGDSRIDWLARQRADLAG